MSVATPHLPPDRLGAALLDPDESVHLSECESCRQQRFATVGSGVSRLGPYRLIGLVGTGGMARVFAAVHPDLPGRRAIKLLSVAVPAMRARFVRESRLMARVAHESVLSLLDVLDLPEGVALVLPLVDGPNLATLLERRRLTEAETVGLAAHLVSGLAAIHAAGLVHRDLKPANVLLDPAGPELGVRIADFGVAKALASTDDPLTLTGMLLGTPRYMAPEQVTDASRVDARADLWAFGCVVHEMLTGRRYEVGDPVEVTGPWGDRLRQLLAEERDDRPADAGAILDWFGAPGPLGAELHQLCRELAVAPAPFDALPTAPMPSIKRHLPPERDPFVGRRAELADLAGRLAQGARLLTILGPGGVGKTRLILRYGARWIDDWPGGVWFCDLSDARTAVGIADAVARGLEVPLADEDPVRRLGHAIASRGRCLVLLDNFEQVAGEAEGTLGRWLDRADQAQFVITSRERLGLAGEQVLPLDPLLPDDAKALFLVRAQSVDAEGDPTGVVELVRLLDHLPLAIELAAARTRMLPVRQLLARMGERFSLVASPAAQGRQSALRSTLDWSWELLNESEREAVAQLSVFAGGFTFGAAEAVLSLGDLWAADALHTLIDKSWVRRVAEDRFDVLMSVREYGADQLRLRGGVAAAEERHGQFYAALVDAGSGAAQRATVRAELENLHLACQRAVARRDPPVAVATLRGAWAALSTRGPIPAAVALAGEVATVVETPLQRAQVATVRGAALRDAGRGAEARAALEDALALFETHHDPRGESAALQALGALHREQGRAAEARVALDRALALRREMGDGVGEGRILSGLGMLDLERGDLTGGVERLEQARALAAAGGDLEGEAHDLSNLGIAEAQRGRPEEALARFEAAMEAFQRRGNKLGESGARTHLGILHRQQGRLPEARAQYTRALALSRELGDRGSEALGLSNLAVVADHLGAADEAIALYRQAVALHGEIGDLRREGNTRGNLANALMGTGRRGEAREQYEAALAAVRRAGDPRLEGNILGNLAGLDREEGRGDEARENLEAALVLLRGVGDRRFQAYVLGQLATLDADPENAFARLDEAEALFREVRDPTELAAVLTARAEVALRVGRQDVARAAVAEAEGLGIAPGSHLGREIARLSERTADG